MSTVGIHGGSAAGSSGQTDDEARAYQTATGTIDANGESVTLALNGAESAAVRFVSSSFVGTVRFYTSHNEGAEYVQCQAVRPLSFDVVNVGTPAFDGSSSVWVFCLTGGETHVRVTSVSYSSGSVDLTFYGSPAPTSAILNAMASSGDNNKPSGHVVIAGARSTGSYPISATTTDPLLSEVGLVVRNVTAAMAEGGAAGGAGYRMLVAGADPDDNLCRTLQLDSAAPDGTEYGLITRNIPSGTQVVGDGGSSLTVDATDLDIRNLAPATDTVAIGDGSATATVRNLAANDALNVAIVDGAGDQVTSFGGGTQYTEGDVDASITGTAAMMEVAGNTLQPVQGTVADGLLVNLGANNDVTVTGTVTSNQGTAGSSDWRVDLRRGQTILFDDIDVSASGDNTIVAADGSNKIKVLQYAIVADAAVTARWKSAATNLSGAMSLAANGGVASPYVAPGQGHLFETAVNEALILNLGGAVGVRGHITYFKEA